MSDNKNNTAGYEEGGLERDYPDNMIMLATVTDGKKTYVSDQYDLNVIVSNKNGGVATCVGDLYHVMVYGDKAKRVRFDFQDHISTTGYYCETAFYLNPTARVKMENPSVIKIKEYNIADVNRDGDVNISDVVAIINTMAGDDTYRSTANVNGDDDINISDVVRVINIIAAM